MNRKVWMEVKADGKPESFGLNESARMDINVGVSHRDSLGAIKINVVDKEDVIMYTGEWLGTELPGLDHLPYSVLFKSFYNRKTQTFSSYYPAEDGK